MSFASVTFLPRVGKFQLKYVMPRHPPCATTRNNRRWQRLRAQAWSNNALSCKNGKTCLRNFDETRHSLLLLRQCLVYGHRHDQSVARHEIIFPLAFSLVGSGQLAEQPLQRGRRVADKLRVLGPGQTSLFARVRECVCVGMDKCVRIAAPRAMCYVP